MLGRAGVRAWVGGWVGGGAGERVGGREVRRVSQGRSVTEGASHGHSSSVVRTSYAGLEQWRRLGGRASLRFRFLMT